MLGDLDLLMGDETQELQEMEAPEGELFLKFKVATGEEFALPAVSVVEVMSIGPEKITPMPNVAPVLLGTLNLRGEIIWVADLGQFLGISPPLNLSQLAALLPKRMGSCPLSTDHWGSTATLAGWPGANL